MSTKIKLEYPYSEDYKVGYLNTNKEPRRVLTLVDKNNKLTSTSYARYLYCCSICKYLPKNIQIDHKDNNPMNDSIDNLQEISISDNIIKRNKFYKTEAKEPIELVCPQCGVKFIKPRKNIITKLNRGKQPCCSRSCGGKQSRVSNISK